MGLVEAVKSVFSHYANFSGRARRSEYWFFYLFNLLAVFIFMILGSILGGIFSGGSEGVAGGVLGGYVLYILYALAAFIPSLAVTVRRLHDTNRSGWNLLWCLLPIVGPIVLLVFMVGDSTPDNQYGPNPKNADIA